MSTRTTTLPTANSLQHMLFKPKIKQVFTNHVAQHRQQVIRFKNPWQHHKNSRINNIRTLLGHKFSRWQTVHKPTQPTCPTAPTSQSIDDWNIWFVGHATVLIQIGTYHFLTDPVWAMRASPVHIAGPKRVRPAGIALEDLPQIDGILLSHNHYDHMDLAALAWLQQRDNPIIYTGLGNAQYLPKHYNIIEMDWWEQIPFVKDKRLDIVYTPAQHFSGRGLRDRNQALWGGLSILTPTDHLFFAGDTGYAPHFKEVFHQLGAPRLALLPIGAYEPHAFFKLMHMNPHDAVQAHLDLQAKQSLAIHYRTFQLTFEAMQQPQIDLESALQRLNVNDHSFVCLTEGQLLKG